MEDVPLRNKIEQVEKAVETYLNKMSQTLGVQYWKKYDEVKVGASELLNQEYEKLFEQSTKSLGALRKHLKRLERKDVKITWIGQLPFASS